MDIFVKIFAAARIRTFFGEKLAKSFLFLRKFNEIQGFKNDTGAAAEPGTVRNAAESSALDLETGAT